MLPDTNRRGNTMIKLYNHNIWGSYRNGEAVANRSGLLLELIRGNDPDIITLQECNPATFRAEVPSIIQQLSDDYAEAAGAHAGENFTPIHDYPPRGDDGNYLPGELPSDTLDYIFTMGEGITAKSFSVLTDAKSLASSDHCPLIAEFEI